MTYNEYFKECLEVEILAYHLLEELTFHKQYSIYITKNWKIYTYNYPTDVWRKRGSAEWKYIKVEYVPAEILAYHLLVS